MDMKWSQEVVVIEKGLDFQYMPNSTGESLHILFQGCVAAFRKSWSWWDTITYDRELVIAL